MTWKQSDTDVTLVCNGTDHDNGVTPMLGAKILENESALNATQRIWAVASVTKGPNGPYTWTATSTHHRCPACTFRASPGNPMADW